MSNLDYPISLLEEAGGKISISLQMTGVEQVQRMNQLNGIIRALNMLKEERMKDEKEIEKKEKLIDKIIKL